MTKIIKILLFSSLLLTPTLVSADSNTLLPMTVDVTIVENDESLKTEYEALQELTTSVLTSNQELGALKAANVDMDSKVESAKSKYNKLLKQDSSLDDEINSVKTEIEKLQAEKAEAEKVEAERVAKEKAEKEAAEKAEQAKQAATTSAATSTTASVPAGSASEAFEQITAELGISASDKAVWADIINKESGWNTTATNASSGAYGLGQALPASKMAAYGSDYMTNPYTQLKWMHAYIIGRYGSFANLSAFWAANHWY